MTNGHFITHPTLKGEMAPAAAEEAAALALTPIMTFSSVTPLSTGK